MCFVFNVMKLLNCLSKHLLDFHFFIGTDINTNTYNNPQKPTITHLHKSMKPSSPKPSDDSIGDDRPLAFSITNILHHVSLSKTLVISLIIFITVMEFTFVFDLAIIFALIGRGRRKIKVVTRKWVGNTAIIKQPS